jgi:hypothetical protein
MDPEFAWACGLFEGEGTAWTDGAARRVAIGMVDRDVLERFQRAVGVGRIRGPYAPGARSKQEMFHWEVCAWLDVVPLLERMLPMLSPRRQEQAAKVLARPPKKNPGSPHGANRCLHGHPASEQTTNTYGHRRCKACDREREEAKRRAASVPARTIRAERPRCSNCTRQTDLYLRKGRCQACYVVMRRTGHEREVSIPGP